MFRTIHGSNHILYPNAYNTIEKQVKPGTRVRSAIEQFTIQYDAAQFISELIYIPKPIEVLDFRTYSMERIEELKPIPNETLCKCGSLLKELVRFLNFMISRNYFMLSFHIFLDIHFRVIILDFSKVGIFNRNPNNQKMLGSDLVIRFPRDPRVYSFKEALEKHEFCFILLPHRVPNTNQNTIDPSGIENEIETMVTSVDSDTMSTLEC